MARCDRIYQGNNPPEPPPFRAGTPEDWQELNSLIWEGIWDGMTDEEREAWEDAQ